MNEVPVRVVIADDHPVFRAGMVTVLDDLPGIEVVGQAGDGRRAVELARHLRPDVCLLDIRMPEMDGIEATERLAGPGVPEPLNVVVITTFDLDEYIFGALRAGAKGFLLKDAGPRLLVEAIHAAADCDSRISPTITTRLVHHYAATHTASTPREPLTDREGDVLAAVSRGLTNDEIAMLLFISLSTVKTHIAKLMAKLDVRNRFELVIWWYQSGRATRA
jgi:DNA-binding NarL/FixJ family response regulator